MGVAIVEDDGIATGAKAPVAAVGVDATAVGDGAGTPAGANEAAAGTNAGMLWRIDSSAWRKSSADWKRSGGSLAMECRMIPFSCGGSPGRTSLGGFGRSCNCAVMIE